MNNPAKYVAFLLVLLPGALTHALHVRINCADSTHWTPGLLLDYPFVTDAEPWVNPESSFSLQTADGFRPEPYNLYKCLRRNVSGKDRHHYSIPVPNGRYLLRLHFALPDTVQNAHYLAEGDTLLRSFSVNDHTTRPNEVLIMEFDVRVTGNDGFTLEAVADTLENGELSTVAEAGIELTAGFPFYRTVEAHTDNREVVVVFDMPLERTTAEEVSNYSIIPGVSVTAAELDADARTVRLQTGTLSRETEYTLTVTGLRNADSPSDSIESPIDTVFRFYETEPLRIMPLGNSITEGNRNDYLSYRCWLWERLTNEGYIVDYVGSRSGVFGGNNGVQAQSNCPHDGYDQDHEGHWGWTVGDALYGCDNPVFGYPGSLTDWLGRDVPDICLLHLGTNDILGALQVQATVNKIRAVVDTLRSYNPSVAVLVAKIIPSERSNGWRIPLFNQQLEDSIPPMDTPESRVLLIDQYAGFSAAEDCNDGTHPNNSGRAKMADKWFRGIVYLKTGNHIPWADAGADTTVGESHRVELDGSLSYDPDGNPLVYTWMQLGGPTVSLESTGAVKTSFTAPSVITKEELGFQLKVSDGIREDYDTVVVTVTGIPDTGDFKAGLRVSAGNDTLRYRLLVPDVSSGQTDLPLLVYLHDSDLRGTDNSRQLQNPTIAHLIDSATLALYPAVILAPQCPEAHRWAEACDPPSDCFDRASYELQPETRTMATLSRVVNDLIDSLSIDTNRLYLVGEGMGAFGIWDYGARYPGWIAGYIPIAGAGDTSRVRAYAGAGAWIFHGGLDGTTPSSGSENMDLVLRHWRIPSELTVYPEAGHEIEAVVWEDSSVTEWLFDRRFGANVLPVAVDDSIILNEDDSVVLAAAANDRDADSDSLYFTVIAGPFHGLLRDREAGDPLIYVPEAHYFGPDTLTYVVHDDRGGSDTGFVYLSVESVPDAPVFTYPLENALFRVLSDATWRDTVTAVDADGDDIIFGVITASHGFFLDSLSGEAWFDPKKADSIMNRITIRVSDGTAEDTLFFMIRIDNVNEPPRIDSVWYSRDSVWEGDTLRFGALATDPDIGDTLRHTWVLSGGDTIGRCDTGTYVVPYSSLRRDTIFLVVDDGIFEDRCSLGIVIENVFISPAIAVPESVALTADSLIRWQWADDFMDPDLDTGSIRYRVEFCRDSGCIDHLMMQDSILARYTNLSVVDTLDSLGRDTMWVRVAALDSFGYVGEFSLSTAFFFIPTHTAVVPRFRSRLPVSFGLAQITPSPSTLPVRIRFAVPPGEDGVGGKRHVSIKMFDVSGRLARTLVDERVSAGYHTVCVDEPSGISGAGWFLIRMEAPGFSVSRRLVVLK